MEKYTRVWPLQTTLSPECAVTVVFQSEMKRNGWPCAKQRAVSSKTRDPPNDKQAEHVTSA